MALNKEKVMDGARKLAEKNQLDKAIKEYLRVVQEDPKDLRVWLKIGDLHLKRGAKQDATEVYLKVANVYQEQGFLQKAVAVYKQVLKIDPHLVDVNLRLAELFRQLGLLGDAMQHFEAVAGHFHREGNTKEALATVRQLVDLDPENVATRIKLAELYSKENLTVDAIKEFSHATEQLRKLGRQEDFIKVSERLLWHQPTNIELSRELAGLYLRRGDARRALQKLQTCFKADGRDVETLAMLAQAFQALEQFAKTVSVLKELAKIHDENRHAAKADEVFRKILEFEPNDPDARARFQKAAAAAGGRPTTPPAAPARAATPPPTRAPAPAPANARVTFSTEAPANSRMTGAVPLIDGNDAAFTMTPTPSLRDQLREDGSYREGSIAGERHAEEIARMLVDTDTYIKYGLHQKAIDRLKRLFELDPDNFEGHERLKDVYLAQGREVEALAELTRLADASAPLDPERAIGYVREALAIDATYLPMHDLARRHRLDVQAPTTQSREQLSSGAIAIVEDDDGFDDLALDAGPPKASPRVGYRPTSAGDDDDFDPQDLIAPPPRHAPHGSPAPARVPGRGAGAFGAAPQVSYTDQVDLSSTGEDEDFALEDVAELPAETRQISVDAAMAMARSPMALPQTDDIDAALRGPSPPNAVGAAGVNWQAPTWTASSAAAPAYNPGLSAQVDAQLDDAALGAEIDHEVAAEFARGDVRDFDPPYDDLPFDPAAARAFDAHVAPARAASVPAFAAPLDDAAADGDPEAELEGEFVGGPPAGAFAHEQPTQLAVGLMDLPVAAPVIDASRASAVLTPPPVLIEDDLDEADFYVTQGMYGQAREILAALLARHPGHRLVTLKLAEVDRAEAGEPLADPDAMGADPALEPTMAATAALAVGEGGTQSIDIDFTSAGGRAAPAAGRPAAALERVHAALDQSSEAIELDELEELDPELDDEVEELADEGDEPAPLAAAPDVVEFGGATVFAPDDRNLGDELAAELDGAFPGDDAVDAPSGNLALDDFRGTTGGRPAVMLEKPVDEGDADTHFDLGQAYKEMGLYDAAIQAFEKAVRAPSRQAQAQLMIGLCHREQGDAVAAASHFKQALHATVLTELERLSLTYELGVTYESLGDVGEALYYLEQVVTRDPSFLDATTRVTALRGAPAGRGVDGTDTSDEHPLR